jgi:hypothetical protein
MCIHVLPQSGFSISFSSTSFDSHSNWFHLIAQAQDPTFDLPEIVGPFKLKDPVI